MFQNERFKVNIPPFIVIKNIFNLLYKIMICLDSNRIVYTILLRFFSVKLKDIIWYAYR